MCADNSYGLGYNVYTVPQGQYLIGQNGRLNPSATLGRYVNYKGAGYFLQPDNWLDESYKHSLRREYNVSVTQGNDKSNFFASVGYLKTTVSLSPRAISSVSPPAWKSRRTGQVLA